VKVAASHALASLTHEDIHDRILRAYGVESLKFGPEYIIPKALDPRVLLWEAPVVAKAAMDTGVARKPLDIDEYRFAAGEETKIIHAAAQVAEEGICLPILLGRPEVIREKIISLGLDCCPEIINPNAFNQIDAYTQAYAELRQRKGIMRREAAKRVLDPNAFGSLMVKMGDADAFVSGLTYEYPGVIRPSLESANMAYKLLARLGGAIAMGGELLKIDNFDGQSPSKLSIFRVLFPSIKS